MRGISLVSLLLFVAGASLLYHGLRAEGGSAYLFLIFPVFVLSGPISLLGTLLIFLSLFLGFLSLTTSLPQRAFELPLIEEMPDQRKAPAVKDSKRWGGILLLGPIPVVFGSDVKITTAMLILAVALTAALFLLFFL
jgi:uncharacterized protein (TIGR00304 family)